MSWLEGEYEPGRDRDGGRERQLTLRKVIADGTLIGGSRRDLSQFNGSVWLAGGDRRAGVSQSRGRVEAGAAERDRRT